MNFEYGIRDLVFAIVAVLILVFYITVRIRTGSKTPAVLNFGALFAVLLLVKVLLLDQIYGK